VMCYLFALDIIGDMTKAIPPNEYPISLPLKLVLFGSPRLGNQAFVEHWRRVMGSHDDRDNGPSVKCYSVKGYNDGVPDLPPHHLGYRHCAQIPLYFAHGHLYYIPYAESEYSAFKIETSATNNSRPCIRTFAGWT